jgi:uncharacterized iron-regulated protein
LDRVVEGAWFDVRRRRNRDDAVAELSSKAVVLLGESHENPTHHRWQLDTVGALFGRRRDMALGFEMFPRRVQPVLDRWSAGELDEASFLSEVDWPRIWGFDPGLYLPLFRFAQTNRLPVVALNVDRETRRRAGAEKFAAIPAAEREGVGEPAPPSSAYRDRLLTWFKRHPGGAADPAHFGRFVRVQLFWDRAMAEAIAGARRGRGRALVIGIMGSGHVEYGDGVPRQLAALGERDVAAALPWPASAKCPAGDPPVADFLFGVASQQDAIEVDPFSGTA